VTEQQEQAHVPKRTHERRTGERIAENQKLDQLFKVKQSPAGETNQGRYLRAVREMAREFSQVIVENTPSCPDQSAALRAVRQAALWSEEAIMRGGVG
jgi:hypothetical protein